MWQKISNFSLHKKTNTFLVIVWTLIIIYGISMPGKEIPKINLFDQVDKVIHFIFFFVWTFLMWMSGTLNFKRLIWIIISATIFGFGIEWYQLNFVTGRSFDVWDGIADMCGAICTIPIVKKISATLGA